MYFIFSRSHLKNQLSFPLLALSLILSGCSSHILQETTITVEKETTLEAELNTGNHLVSAAIQQAVATPIISEPSVFLESLSASDIELVKREASRTMLPMWGRINDRSEAVRYRIHQVLVELDAPKELLYVPVAESSYNPYALSPAGAFGLWQLMPGTAKELGAYHKNGIDGRRHIEASTRAAASYMLSLHKRFDSWPLAICAYNLGPWGVERRLRKKPWTPEMGLDALPFPAETRHYVKQILGMIALSEEGILTFSDALPTVDIQINAPIDLSQMEKTSGLEKHGLFRLNPGFDFQHYILRNLTVYLPYENAVLLEQAILNNPDIFKPKFVTIRIKKGDSLWKIAHKHHTSIAELKRLNPKLRKTLSIGKRITVPASGSFTAVSSKANPLLSQGRRIRYKVRSGDSLWKIAKKFGTSTRAIARANQMPANKLIRPGDKIWVIARFQPS